MRKIFGISLSIAMVLCLVACIGVPTVNAPSETTTASIEPATNDSEYPNMYIFIDDGDCGCYNLWSSGEVIHDEEYDHYDIIIDPILLVFKILESRYPDGVGTMSNEEVNAMISSMDGLNGQSGI